ncbi:MAG: ABC transporter permease [Anaerolineae bacterium]|nr:ABC transporter permease [Anaerolineae bacterium]MDW8067885.1 ABC transporter permease [Anaerolineae bacterium]
MFGYGLRRLLEAVLVLWLAATLAFGAMHLTPGDPAQTLLAASGASADEVARRRVQLGLDDPLPVQYVRYLADLARGDLGVSWLHGRSVRRMILEQLPATAELALAATLFGALVGVVLGLLAALYRGTWVDALLTGLAVLGLSTPVFWSGLLAILLFSLHLRWFPSAGSGGLPYLVLPTATLGFALAGSVARMVRAQVVEALRMPYVLAALARGIPPWRILLVHVLRPALGPAVAVVALQLGFLLSGAVVTESVFARQGLGRLAVQAILWRDLPVVRGVVLVGALAYLLTGLLADLIQVWLDPRLRQ